MRIDILGVGFDNYTMEEAVDFGKALIREDGTHYVVTPNPEIVEVCRENSAARDAVNGADLVIADGIGVIYGAKLLHTPLKQKLPGIEFAQNLMGEMAKEQTPLFLLGAKPGIAELAAECLREKYRGLVIAGFHDGYFTDDEAVADEIRRSGAKVVFVCLGAPKQELWMAQWGERTGARLLLGLGGALDVFSGTVKRAPPIFSKLGLEWFYRLLKQPSRFKRTMRLPMFLVHVMQSRGKNAG